MEQKDENVNVKLTTRELAILLGISEGKTTKAMAVDLKVSYHTIVHQRARLYKKLAVSCVADAIRKGRKLNYIPVL